MTFTPEAQFDPSALEAAVSKVDFTATGVIVWLRGAVNTNDLPAVGTNESSGQRFLLVATDDMGKAAIDAAREAPPGSVTLYGKASRASDTFAVRVQVEGGGESE